MRHWNLPETFAKLVEGHHDRVDETDRIKGIRETKAFQFSLFFIDKMPILNLKEVEIDEHKFGNRHDSVIVRTVHGLPDPRNPQGRRHALAAMLTLAATAILSGAKTLTDIAQFGRR